MAERETANKAYPLFTMVIGFISFLICGITFGLINEGMALILGIPVGSLLMLFLLGKLDKDKILPVIIRSLIGGILGVLAGFMIGELLHTIIGFLIPTLSDSEQIKSQIIPNLFVIIIANTIFGVILADLYYGRKSISFFALACAIASIPFGILLSVPISIAWISFDQNLLIIVTSLGTTTGLAVGLYNLLKSKNIN